MQKRVGHLPWCALALAAGVLDPQLALARGFSIEDYGSLRRFEEAGISPDGRRAFYVTEQLQERKPSPTRQVFVQELKATARATLPEALADGRALAWRGNDEIAYICPRDGKARVCVYDLRTQLAHTVTQSADPVVGFAYSRDGLALAVISEPALPAGSTFFDRTRTGQSGIIVDLERDYFDEFFNAVPLEAAPRKLTIVKDDASRPIDVPGRVDAVFWSPTGQQLSIRYGSGPVIPGMQSYAIGILDVTGETLKTIVAVSDANAVFSGKSPAYTGGDWEPYADALRVYRVRIRDGHLWRQSKQVALVNPKTGEAKQWSDVDWYGFWSPRVFPVRGAAPYIEDVIRGQRSLYVGFGGPKASFLESSKADASLFSRSDDGRFLFVLQSLTRPPELFVQQGAKSHQVTRLNEDIEKRVNFRARKLAWTGRDGMKLDGWLLEPASEPNARARPMVTYVHGGPGIPITNSFEDSARFWPHPLGAFAEAGFAVFLPNYRGTGSFGAQYAEPEQPDAEPIDDVVAGVEELIRSGVADGERLGIIGYSAGGWLAPMIATRSNLFLAGSAAEGWSNQFALYNATPSWLNRAVHEPGYGGGPEAIPQRYVELSPDLHFSKVRTRFLFEAGAKKAGTNYISLPKAAYRAGTPTEYVVYPRTAHMLGEPALRRESAERTFDWMRFWLLGAEDPKPEKADQYRRWRQMKAGAAEESP